MDDAVAGGLAGFTGLSIAALTAPIFIERAPRRLFRRNVDAVMVPAVLGFSFVLGAALGALAGVVLAGDSRAAAIPAPVALGITLGLLVVLGGAGAWDDLGGEESSKGFRGHLRSLGAGRLTGGFVKIVAGGVAGLGAAAFVTDGFVEMIVGGAVIALSANLINLFDRAPGRAAKVCILILIGCLFVVPPPWVVLLAGALGALVGVFRWDLRAAGMLGDAGSNPSGAVAGLGLVVASSAEVRVLFLVILLGLNAASEKWSFSRIIERSPVLGAIDRAGRRRAA